MRAVSDLVGRLRTEAPDGKRASELSVALGCLLGQQWCVEFSWEWRLVDLGSFEGYGAVPADRRFVYFPMQDIYDLLVSEADELNLLLLFNIAGTGSLPPPPDFRYIPVG